jgi:hypothetical protein
MYLISWRVQDIATEKYCDTQVETTGLCFNYPKGWVITHYDDQFTSGQKNLQIEDSVTGVRMTIEKLQVGQAGMKGPRIDEFGHMYELGEMCDGSTCPMNEYYFQYGENENSFAIRTYYEVSDYNKEVPIIKSYLKTILSSLETGP